MKKIKIKSKLSLDKMTVAKLNDQQVKEVVGGRKSFLCTIGKRCKTTL